MSLFYRASSNSDEKTVYTEVPMNPVPSRRNTADTTVSAWKPGFLERMPWTGTAALILTVVCTIASVFVLVKSDGDPIEDWRYQPALLLSIFSAVSGALVRYAFFEGVTIAWWKKAIEGGTLGDLHNLWSHADGILAAILAGKHTRLLTVSSIMVTVFVMEGPLLQRASTTHTITQVSNTTLQAHVPTQWTMFTNTGYEEARLGHLVSLSQPFLVAVKGYMNRSPITGGVTNCTGTCTTEIQAAGWDVQCASNVTKFDHADLVAKYDGPYTAYAKVFHTSFKNTVDYGSNKMFEMAIHYSNSTDAHGSCPGFDTRKLCSVYPATVTYPLTVTNNSVTLSPPPPEGYHTTRRSFHWQNVQGNTDPLGGFTTVLQRLFDSHATLYFDGINGWSVSNGGLTADTYLDLPPGLADSINPFLSCNVSYSDPTADIVQALHEMSFRAGLSLAQKGDMQEAAARQTMRLVVYQTNYVYFAAALAIVIATVAVVFATYLGWWVLGRDMSMSPLAIAKAFDAPLMSSAESNLSITQLKKSVGKFPVQYKAVAEGHGADEAGKAFGDAPGVEVRIKMAHPDIGHPIGRSGTA